MQTESITSPTENGISPATERALLTFGGKHGAFCHSSLAKNNEIAAISHVTVSCFCRLKEIRRISSSVLTSVTCPRRLCRLANSSTEAKSEPFASAIMGLSQGREADYSDTMATDSITFLPVDLSNGINRDLVSARTSSCSSFPKLEAVAIAAKA